MALTPGYIKASGAHFWVDVTKPADTATLTRSGAGFASGSEVGLTQAPLRVHYQPTYREVDAQQVMGAVFVFITAEVYINASDMLEVTGANAKISGGTQLSFASSGSAPAIGVLKGGGIALNSMRTFCFIHAHIQESDGSAGQYYDYGIGYKGYSDRGLEYEYNRVMEAKVAMNFRAIHDTSRTIGDRLFQIVYEA